jgi:conjugal transfer/entry exclusion protein
VRYQFSQQYNTSFYNNTILVFTTIQDQFSQYKTGFYNNTRPVFTTIQDPFSQQYKTSFHSNTRHLVTEIKLMCILIVNFLDGARELKYFVMD